jgi:hypothetical protein
MEKSCYIQLPSRVSLKDMLATGGLADRVSYSKTSKDTVIYLDSYLFKFFKVSLRSRTCPSGTNWPQEVRFDAVISTHWHEDHLDPGLIPVVSRNDPDAKFIMPPSATAYALSWRVRRSQIVLLQQGQSKQWDGHPSETASSVPEWEVVHGVDDHGKVVLRKQLRRSQVMAFFAQRIPCLVGMEACGGAHEWARRLTTLGIRMRLPEILEDAEIALPGLSRQLLRQLGEHLRTLDQLVDEMDQQIQQWHRSNEASQRLTEIAGVGPITATAMVASIGDARNFSSGRQLAAWLGLVPRQHSSGGKSLLLGISKRGDCYLRTLLIHGARAVIRCAGRRRKEEITEAAGSSIVQSRNPGTGCNQWSREEERMWLLLLWPTTMHG